MTISILPERPDTADAMQLIDELTADLGALGYPEASTHGYSIEKLLREGVAFFVVRCDGLPAGCGGVQLFGVEYGELKRMYVRPEYRRHGLGKLILDHLAEYARRHNVAELRLETGIYQAAAIAMYERFGFERRGPFGLYVDDPLSLYYAKGLEYERRIITNEA